MRYLLLLGLAAFSAVNALENDNPCQCPMIWKPVCGTDGVTYPNECILKCVKLALEPALEVAHQGACKHVQQAAQEEEVQGSEESCGCQFIWEPVCGNDGLTYPSECILNCVKLKLKPELEVAHQGPCYKQVLQAAQEEVVQSSEEPCVCPFIWKPVCGNDGNTYPNECTLKCVKLVLEPGLEVAHQGACKHRLLAAQEEKVQRSEKSCACPIIWEPVCGNDGLTYPSECILNCVKLKLKPELEVAHKGACYKHALQAAQQEEVQRSEGPN